LTWSFFHFDLLHLLMNLVAFIPLGSMLEQRIGTLQSLHLFLVILPVVSGLLYFLTAMSGSLLGLHLLQGPLYSCVAGLSGSIFSLIVIDTVFTFYHQRQNQQQHRVLCFFTVPLLYYPWALLLFIQLLIPQASFLGHLVGMLTGYFYCWGWLAWLQLPESVVTRLEENPRMHSLTHLQGFHRHHQDSLPFTLVLSPPSVPSSSRYFFFLFLLRLRLLLPLPLTPPKHRSLVSLDQFRDFSPHFNHHGANPELLHLPNLQLPSLLNNNHRRHPPAPLVPHSLVRVNPLVLRHHLCPLPHLPILSHKFLFILLLLLLLLKRNKNG